VARDSALFLLTEGKLWCRLIKSQFFLQRWTARCEPFRLAAMEWTCRHLKVETKHCSYHRLAFFDRLCNRHRYDRKQPQR
jgi:hypothetical protein